MTTAVIENSPELLSRVTELQDRISAVQEELQALLRGVGYSSQRQLTSAGWMDVPLPE